MLPVRVVQICQFETVIHDHLFAFETKYYELGLVICLAFKFSVNKVCVFYTTPWTQFQGCLQNCFHFNETWKPFQLLFSFYQLIYGRINVQSYRNHWYLLITFHLIHSSSPMKRVFVIVDFYQWNSPKKHWHFDLYVLFPPIHSCNMPRRSVNIAFIVNFFSTRILSICSLLKLCSQPSWVL